jgi:hypothetical protein
MNLQFCRRVLHLKGKGLFMAISHLLFDAALVEDFVNIKEISEFLDEEERDVISTTRVLHNIMVAVSQQEYQEIEKKVLSQIETSEYNKLETGKSHRTRTDPESSYTMNPIVFSLIEKGISSTPVYSALNIVISQLLSQWEDSAHDGKLSEFTIRLSEDNREGMVKEISRRVALRETCELTEEEAERYRKFPMTIEMFKRIVATRFLKAYKLGNKLDINIAPSDVITYISRQLRKEGFPK